MLHLQSFEDRTGSQHNVQKDGIAQYCQCQYNKQCMKGPAMVAYPNVKIGALKVQFEGGGAIWIGSAAHVHFPSRLGVVID